MARLAAEGHRVVLVVATDGEAGLADALAGDELGTVRRAEALSSARALGVERVEFLGYHDSGMTGAAPEAFCRVPAADVAARLAKLLIEEDAELVTIYDPVGGYGHPDHVHVHEAGVAAARLAGTPIVLEATIDRALLLRGMRFAGALGLLPGGMRADVLAGKYSPRDEITHRVNVRRHVRAKRASMACHSSQAGGGESTRTLAALLRLPLPLFRLALGTEWYVRRDVPAGTRLRHPLDHC